MIAAVVLAGGLQVVQIVAGPVPDSNAIQSALDIAAPGDTVLIAAGTYHEHVVVDKPVFLLGEPGAVIDGGGSGTVLRVNAPAVISGFTIRNSGANQSQEDSGILVERSPGVRIEHNRLEDVLFGVYVKQSDRPLLRDNYVRGKDVPIPLRGDGIRLWYSHDGVIESNTLVRCRDLVIWFSDGTGVRSNTVSDSRYGLHYMYSDHGRFRNNRFTGNEVGAFLMYSTDIRFENNEFVDARGVTGRGLGFKDTDSIVAVNNFIARNAIGVSVDNSPTTLGVLNLFQGNLIAFNEVGVQLLPSVRSNRFWGNDFVDNLEPVAVTGGGDALHNDWFNNYWSSYFGFDGDGDGSGDTPFVYERLSADLMAQHEELRVFNLGIATLSLDLLSRALPLIKPAPVLVDSVPRRHAAFVGAATVQRRSTSYVLATALFLVSLAAAAVALLVRHGWRSTA